MVKPGGTGNPALVISARPEPFPPSRSFMVRLPSALPLPKKYTCCLWAFALSFFAIDVCSVRRLKMSGFRFRGPALTGARGEMREIAELRHAVAESFQQLEPRPLEPFVRHDDTDF